MHMHCVFFNLVGAKSRRVPLLVPTSSLSLLQWPLLYKHVAEIQLPWANSRTQPTAPPRRQSIISGMTTEILSYSSAHNDIKTLRAVWQRQREREIICMMVHWCHGESKTEQWLLSLKFSLLHTGTKTFSDKSKSFGNFFLSPFSWKHIEKWLFCIHLPTCNSIIDFVIWPKAWQKENSQHH